jgi:hypothetical protein
MTNLRLPCSTSFLNSDPNANDAQVHTITTIVRASSYTKWNTSKCYICWTNVLINLYQVLYLVFRLKRVSVNDLGRTEVAEVALVLQRV